MKQLWYALGRLAFWLSRPAIQVYLSFGTRTRIIVCHGEDVLVVKGWLGGGTWMLPGGGLHRGENPLHGVLRELREETGLVLNPAAVYSLGTHRTDQGLRYTYHLFVASVADTPPLRRQRLEIIALSWLPRHELQATTLGDEATRQALAIWDAHRQ